MNLKLDHDQIILMARSGVHPAIIAERVGCSRRQVDRIKQQHDIHTYEYINIEDEHEAWEMFHSLGESQSQIARRFGISRQAVHKHLQSITNKELIS